MDIGHGHSRIVLAPLHGVWGIVSTTRRCGPAYDIAYEAVVLDEGSRAHLDKGVVAMATDSAWAGVVGRLGYLRGIDALTSISMR